MAGKPVKVAFLADTSELQQSLDKAKAAMGEAATEAQTSGAKMDTAFSGVAQSADGVASASSQAAGGLGDLGGALSLIPGPLGALGTGMEAAAPAIMGVTGAADLLNFATEKFPILAKAQAAATKAVTAAQKALNLVMKANPIGLVIVAITLLVGALAVLYNKNEGFRELVDKVWSKVKTAIGSVADFMVEKVWPKISGAIGSIREGFETIREKVTGVVGSYSGDGGGVLGKLWSVVDKIGGMKAAITSKAAGMWDGIKDSFRGVINAMIGWWNNLSFSIDIPDKIPGLPDSFSISTPNIPYLADGGIVTRPTLAVIGEAGPEAVVPLNGRYGMGTVIVNHFHVPALANPVETGREVQRVLDAYTRAGGRPAFA